MVLGSNLMSNVPVTQLIVSTGAVTKGVAPILAVGAGFAGNLGPLASFANMLAFQMARKSGVSVSRILLVQMIVGAVAFIPALF